MTNNTVVNPTETLAAQSDGPELMKVEQNTQRLIGAVIAGYSYNPGDSDLDDEQPVWVKMTLGDYRLACQLKAVGPLVVLDGEARI